MGKFGATEAWIAFALLFLIFAEYAGAAIAKRVLTPRRSAAPKPDPAPTDMETGP